MNIQIKSRFMFNEIVHDKAYGLAKKLIMNGRDKAVKRIDGFVLTARKSSHSVFVKVQRDIQEG